MNKAFEKILEELEKYKYSHLVERDSEQLVHCKEVGDCSMLDCSLCIFDKAIKIVQQVVEEYNNGWIPCSERMPEEDGMYLTTSKIYFTPDHVDEIDNYIGIKISCYSTRFGWDDEVFAWQPLPEQYQPKGECKA